MKYYISNLKAIDIEKINILNDCIKKEEVYLLIFSLQGIFKINTNTNIIKKIINNDSEIKLININNYELLEDNSKHIYVDFFQIPSQHFTKKIRQETYLLRENAQLKFIIIKDDMNDNIIDFYFYTNDCINNSFVIQDITSFLSFKNI